MRDHEWWLEHITRGTPILKYILKNLGGNMEGTYQATSVIQGDTIYITIIDTTTGDIFDLRQRDTSVYMKNIDSRR